MAARGEAQADVEVSTLVVPAWRLRWRAPELALVLGERAVALASARRDEVDRLRAESLVVFASNRVGRGVKVADRALDALKAAEAESEHETAWRLRVELAHSARAVGAPLTGFAAVRPVLEAEGVPDALRASALVQASECLVSVGRGSALTQALEEADQLYTADPVLDHDTALLLRGMLRAAAAGQHRRWGDLDAAIAAAREGIELLDQLGDAEADSGQVRGSLVVELVCALMDADKHAEASEAGTPFLERPVRAPSATPAGWLRLALATRVHLPAGRVDQARDLLREAADSADRHQLDTLLAESLLALAHVHEVSGDLTEALADLRSAHAAERRRARSVYAVRARLAAEFAGVHRQPSGLHDQLAALLRREVVPGERREAVLPPEVKQQLRQWRPVQVHRAEGLRVKRARRAAEDMTVEGISAARAHAADRWRLVQPFGDPAEAQPASGGRRRAPEPDAGTPETTQGRPEHTSTAEARPRPRGGTYLEQAFAHHEPRTPSLFPPLPPALQQPQPATRPTPPPAAAQPHPAPTPPENPPQFPAPEPPPTTVPPATAAPMPPPPVAPAPTAGPVTPAAPATSATPATPPAPATPAAPAAPAATTQPESAAQFPPPAPPFPGTSFPATPFASTPVTSAAFSAPEPSVVQPSEPEVAVNPPSPEPELPAQPEAVQEGSGDRTVSAAGLIAAAGAVRSGRRRAAREAAESEEQAVVPQGSDGGSVLETLKAAGLLDPQRAGGRRRAPEVEETGPSDEVQWRVEAPQRLREAGDVDMFDSPAMVKPSEPDEDLPPVGLGAAFIKGPVIPTARAPEPLPEPLPEPGIGTSDTFLGFGDVEPDEPAANEPVQSEPFPGESAPAESVPAETPVAETSPTPEPAPEPTPEPTPEVVAVPEVVPDPEPLREPEPASTPEPAPVEEVAAEGEPGEPFVRTVVVGGRTIDLTDGSPSATRASRRPKSDLSLAELLAEALVAYEAGRREDEAAQTQHQRTDHQDTGHQDIGHQDTSHQDSAESTVPITPVAPPVTDSETTAPIERVTLEPPRWTLPES